MRPTNPAADNKIFEIQTGFLPANFLRRIVIVPSINGTDERHLILLTPLMEHYLPITVRWFLDGTFKIVGGPFVQLFTISGFISIQGKFYLVKIRKLN